jgi:hypothetical protein
MNDKYKEEKEAHNQCTFILLRQGKKNLLSKIIVNNQIKLSMIIVEGFHSKKNVKIIQKLLS